MKRIGVLISGGGTNLQALIDKQGTVLKSGKIVCVCSNNSKAYGLERAKNAGIATKVIRKNADCGGDNDEFNREICAYMKEIGLSENLKSVGIFNFNANSEALLNHQLLAQIIWHLIEGINIQKSHPVERLYETFWVLIDDDQFAFKRDTFTDLWYFGEDEKVANLIPCSRFEYEEAKRGVLNPRLIKN